MLIAKICDKRIDGSVRDGIAIRVGGSAMGIIEGWTEAQQATVGWQAINGSYNVYSAIDAIKRDTTVTKALMGMMYSFCKYYLQNQIRAY